MEASFRSFQAEARADRDSFRRAVGAEMRSQLTATESRLAKPRLASYEVWGYATLAVLLLIDVVILTLVVAKAASWH